MKTLFPFGFPAPTATYLALYTVTLVAHVLLMNYVLAGSGLLAARAVLGWVSRRHRPDHLAEVVLRDWLPFFLGAAITAGVAPLLFLQVLYKERFYTANLLLIHRWMALLPALIVAFYLLYVMKTAWFQRAAALWRLGIATVAWGLFVFVAWAFTENHLLALRDVATWTNFYRSEAIFFSDPALAYRLGIWIGGSLPVMATIVLSQIKGVRSLRLMHPESPASAAQAFAVAGNIAFEARRLAAVAWGGLAVAGCCALGYPHGAEAAVLWGPLCGPFGLAGSVGVMVHAATWWRVRRRRCIERGSLAALWVSLIAIVCGVVVAREGLRLASLDITALYEQPAQAASVGGIGAFAVFGIVNSALMVWSVRLAMRGRQKDGPNLK